MKQNIKLKTAILTDNILNTEHKVLQSEGSRIYIKTQKRRKIKDAA